MATTNNNNGKKVSNYTENVLLTNKKFKEESKSLGGVIKTLYANRKEIELSETFIFILENVEIGTAKANKFAYELIKRNTKPNHKSGKYCVFYLLQGLNRITEIEIDKLKAINVEIVKIVKK